MRHVDIENLFRGWSESDCLGIWSYSRSGYMTSVWLSVHPKVSFLSFVLFFSSLKDPCSIISEFCLSRYSFDVCYSLYICVCIIYITHTVTIHILDVADIHIALYTSATSKNINNFLVFFIISGYLMNLNYNL